MEQDSKLSRWLRTCLLVGLVASACAPAVPVSTPPAGRTDSIAVSAPTPAQLSALRAYITKTWEPLTRTIQDLPRAAEDPKFPTPAGGAWPVYVVEKELPRVTAELERALRPEERARIALEVLPADTRSVTNHGLLYLPRPYIVPGGRFNEMYGWDSYFILVGLLRDGLVDRARDLVENFAYEIAHYGTILNANRTYYLSRSQPPFFSRMVLEVFQVTQDRAWLQRMVGPIDAHYAYWTRGEHLAGETGLSRYYDFGDGPAPEAVSDERDAQGRSHYDRARELYRTTSIRDYDVSLFYDAARDALTPLFYKGDRSMRESGFDPSNRFGPLSVDIVHYAPVCLNSLLYQMERDGAEIAAVLGDPDRSREWLTRAEARKERVNQYLWDDERGVYFDYSFRTGSRRQYMFATTFYPLWVGLASPEQARRVRERLADLEAPGGLLTSTTRSGAQWDAPFGWAPLQLIAVRGLRRYGYGEDAARLAGRFVALVAKELEEHGKILEKYDVQRRESDVAPDIRFGYSANQAGFGWTNGAVLELIETRTLPSSTAPHPSARLGVP